VWQKIIVLAMTLITHSALALVTSQNDHLAAAKKKYPYSLIGEDYDILNESDLAANSCEVESGPLLPNSHFSIYWHCFDTKDVHFRCDLLDDDTPGVAHLQGWLHLKIEGKDSHHEYMTRHPFDIASCRSYERTFHSLTKNTQHVCVAGSLINMNEVEENGEKLTSWLFEKYKTVKGCDSNFADVCDLNKMIKNHHCDLLHANK
jgi:hypothetical protein